MFSFEPSKRSQSSRRFIIALATVLSMAVGQLAFPDYRSPILNAPSANAQSSFENLLLDGYFADTEGRRIEGPLTNGDEYPHQLVVSIKVPEGVQDGDTYRFYAHEELTVLEGDESYHQFFKFLNGATSQVFSSGNNSVAIAEVVGHWNHFSITFNRNADAERGSQLFEEAHQVSVLLQPNEKKIHDDGSYYSRSTKDPALNGHVIKNEVSVDYKLSQSPRDPGQEEFLSVGTGRYVTETRLSLPPQTALHYYSFNYITSGARSFGSPQPTEMLVDWGARHYHVSFAASKSNRDLSFRIEIPEGIELKQGSDGSYLSDYRVTATSFLSEEEAIEQSAERWGDFEGPRNPQVEEQLAQRITEELSSDGRVLTITFTDAPAGYGYRLTTTLKGSYSEYEGEAQRKTWRASLVEESIGEGFLGNATRRPDQITSESSHTSPKAAGSGISDPKDVVRNADIKVSVLNHEAENPARITPGTTSYSVLLENNSNVAIRLNSITLPDGSVKDMNERRIRVGSSATLNFDIDEEPFAGVQDRPFRAKFALMDEIEGKVSVQSIHAIYSTEPVESVQTVTTTVPAPAKFRENITFGPAENTPDWVTVKTDGSLSITPPRTLQTGIHTIPVQVTYADGSSEAIEARINVVEAPSAMVDGLAIAISGDEPDNPADVVSNLADLPEGTTITWKYDVPTDKLGKSEHIAVVTYPDGSTEEIKVPVAVVLNQEQYEHLQNERDKARESVSELDNRLNNGLGRCISTVGGSLLALIPAVIIASQLLGGLNIPQLDRFIADTQRQLGIFNPHLAKLTQDNRGAISGALAIASIIPLFFVPNLCRDASLAGAIGEQLSS